MARAWKIADAQPLAPVFFVSQQPNGYEASLGVRKRLSELIQFQGASVFGDAAT